MNLDKRQHFYCCLHSGLNMVNITVLCPFLSLTNNFVIALCANNCMGVNRIELSATDSVEGEVMSCIHAA